jgi:hypothetical protein
MINWSQVLNLDFLEIYKIVKHIKLEVDKNPTCVMLGL